MPRPFNLGTQEDQELVGDLIDNEGLDYYFVNYEPVESFDNHPMLKRHVENFLHAREGLVKHLQQLGVRVET